MAKATAEKKAAAQDGTGVDEKTEKAAFDLRRQGATAAIICHSLGVSYATAQRLAAAFDAKAGHPPQKVIRLASEIKAPAGVTVKDGAKVKAAPKKKAAAKA